jgi:general secretion pathway protein F
MGTFAYIARNASGEKITGRVTAANEQAVLAELHGRQLSPVRVNAVRETQLFVRRKVSARQLATAYRQISDLLRAGVPLLRALRLVGRSKASPRLGAVVTEIADEVADGGALADAMMARSEIFPVVDVAMVRAGEKGGFLEEVMGRMGRFIEHQADIRAKVVGNLIYPGLLLSFGFGVVIFALVFLVPKFSDFYSKIELPLPTQILLASSDIFTRYWVLIVVGTVGVAVGVWRLARRPAARRVIAAWQLKIPRLGVVTRDLAVGRFTRILGTLLENGIPMLQAMQISRDAVGHPLLTDAVDEATEAVRAGETLAEPLAESGMFAEEMVEMISVGESANNLPEVLITMADTIERRVDRMLTAFVRLMEPMLLLSMAGVVLFIFIALMVPMLRMGSAI